MKTAKIQTANDQNNVLGDLIFWICFPPLWIIVHTYRLVVKIPQLFHRIFVRIPDYGSRFWINPLGVFRLFFWFWICAASISYSWEIKGNFPWIGLKEYNNMLESFIKEYTFGLGYIPLLGYFLWAILVGSACVICNMSSNSKAPANLGYDSSYENVNEALRFRDAEMAQNTSDGKMNILAETGFLTGGSFKGHMTENEQEAARFLDAHLAQQSSAGKLQALKDLFAGRR